MMDKSRSDSIMTMNTSTSSMSTLEGYNGAVKTDTKLVSVQCEPKLVRSDQVPDE